MFFVRDQRTPLKHMVPMLDDAGPAIGLERTVERKKRRNTADVHRVLLLAYINSDWTTNCKFRAFASCA